MPLMVRHHLAMFGAHWFSVSGDITYLGYKKIQVIRRNQVYFSSSNVSIETAVIVKDSMLNEKFTFCFKITIKWNLTKSHATRLKSAKYKTHVIKEQLLK